MRCVGLLIFHKSSAKFYTNSQDVTSEASEIQMYLISVNILQSLPQNVNQQQFMIYTLDCCFNQIETVALFKFQTQPLSDEKIKRESEGRQTFFH